jgi:hypothetical protein
MVVRLYGTVAHGVLKAAVPDGAFRISKSTGSNAPNTFILMAVFILIYLNGSVILVTIVAHQNQ